MREILFLEPVFKSMIWGGDRLKTQFGYQIPDDYTGECWAISAHKNGDCRIKNGIFAGERLSRVWEDHREVFGNVAGNEFPLLVKIIDAKKDLSIQVHPDDAYAKRFENGALGKTECWYILDCPQDGQIVIGHNATNKEELKDMISQDRWQELIRLKPVKAGDFFQIEPGTVHAIKAGTLLLETQQSSDVTYRLYDYGRLDNGKPRELHIRQSIDVITCPHRDVPTGGREEEDGDCIITELITCRYYTVRKLKLNGEKEFVQDQAFMNISIISGGGEIDGQPVKKGDHFIIPADYGTFRLSGSMELIQSYL